MKDKPQLPAEMEKRYNAIMLEWIESQWKIEQAHQAREPYTRMKFEADASKVEDKLKHFLATALEEQRASMIAEIESWLVDEEVHELENASWDEMRQQASKIGRNELRAELRAKLVEMKEVK